MKRKPTICPCCDEVLFTLGIHAEREGFTSDGPKIRHDSNGFFMCCRLCNKRVVFNRVADDQAKITYQVAPTQLCALCQ